MVLTFVNLSGEEFLDDFSEEVGKEVAGRVDLGGMEISFVLVSDEEIKKINRKYRGINKPTDVLSFALAPTLGEIFISIDRARDQAHEDSLSLRAEIGFLLIHGLLHLSGQDHEEKKEREAMFTLQDRLWQNIFKK